MKVYIDGHNIDDIADICLDTAYAEATNKEGVVRTDLHAEFRGKDGTLMHHIHGYCKCMRMARLLQALGYIDNG